MSPLRIFWLLSAISVAIVAGLALLWQTALWAFVVVGPLILLGVYDSRRRSHAVIRNFPIIGRARYWMESIRPEIQQYFVESDSSGRPFNRELRSIVYQRAKVATDTRPFGTIRDLHEVGTEWIAHSLMPKHRPEKEPRIVIGQGRCAQPYPSSTLNVSAMSYGSLSKNAILALNGGARLGGFAHNTGEGGISSYHLEYGADLIWQVGTGYFGCRTSEGAFDADRFAGNATRETVKMIEIKLSQGAKPGHGGILPAAKVTPEIAEIRGVPLGQDVISPPCHRTFSTPTGLLEFVARLRELSGGKPVGFKLCVGQPSEFLSICKAMVETGLLPDFITVDGAEGGTGAAPLEFSNSIGMPLTDGLLFVHNALVGCDLRRQIRVICSAKIVTGFNLVQRMAIGADLCNSARAMMFALGCIQALKCNTNHCPVGVATQEPDLVRGLCVADKKHRVYNYHRNTVNSMLDMLGAAGLSHPEQLRPRHIQRRISPTQVQDYGRIYRYVERGALLSSSPPDALADAWAAANSERF
ncbi:MAG: FMN-binding glutamate synthase family protein [bacterium]|nr:FMN-binding glutamate synthase family protein [bacterium]